jgi:hypothetical protein
VGGRAPSATPAPAPLTAMARREPDLRMPEFSDVIVGTSGERVIASGQCGVGCQGCYRIMRALVEPLARTTCSKTCEVRVLRRRLPRPPGRRRKHARGVRSGSPLAARALAASRSAIARRGVGPGRRMTASWPQRELREIGSALARGAVDRSCRRGPTTWHRLRSDGPEAQDGEAEKQPADERDS